jgi:hypothetical protein
MIQLNQEKQTAASIANSAQLISAMPSRGLYPGLERWGYRHECRKILSYVLRVQPRGSIPSNTVTKTVGVYLDNSIGI